MHLVHIHIWPETADISAWVYWLDCAWLEIILKFYNTCIVFSLLVDVFITVEYLHQF